uniref:HAD family hydrolase n=1 Tax=Desulfobacca acetoxidans TaxID=60893 RepID=A0A7V4LBY2_9BACT
MGEHHLGDTMSIEAVIFDLYGTLIDIWTDETDLSLYHTMCRFFTYYDIFFEPEELAARYQEYAAAQLLKRPGPYGDIDVFDVFQEILAEGLKKTPERALVIWTARLFRSLSRRHFALFPDALPALEALQPHYRLGLVTDAQWVFSEPEMRILGLNRFFETVVLSSRHYVRKPAPQIYTHALKAMWLPPEKALYVGNDPREDVPGPQAIHMPVVLIDREGHHPGFPGWVIRDLRELPAFLETHFPES